MQRIVVRVRVEPAEIQVRAHGNTRLERQHRELRLTAQRAPLPLDSLFSFFNLVLGRDRVRVRF